MQAKNSGKPAMPGSPAMDMRDWIGEAVDARRHIGKAEALHQVSRELRIPARRVRGILGGEIARVWADEWQVARDWYRRQCETQADKLAHEAEMYRQRAGALKERIK